jgi:HSP20 family molecular chaperone IbpA
MISSTPPWRAVKDWMAEAEGQLAVDVYQTKENVVIKAPIAGVTPDKIDIEVAEDVVTIRGERVEEKEVDREHYYVQECYWGSFSRSVILPTSPSPRRPLPASRTASSPLTIPKVAQDKVKKIKVKPVSPSLSLERTNERHQLCPSKTLPINHRIPMNRHLFLSKKAPRGALLEKFGKPIALCLAH